MTPDDMISDVVTMIRRALDRECELAAKLIRAMGRTDVWEDMTPSQICDVIADAIEVRAHWHVDMPSEGEDGE